MCCVRFTTCYGIKAGQNITIFVHWFDVILVQSQIQIIGLKSIWIFYADELTYPSSSATQIITPRSDPHVRELLLSFVMWRIRKLKQNLLSNLAIFSTKDFFAICWYQRRFCNFFGTKAGLLVEHHFTIYVAKLWLRQPKWLKGGLVLRKTNLEKYLVNTICELENIHSSCDSCC